jgi:AcrR family transcriptional regulator
LTVNIDRGISTVPTSRRDEILSAAADLFWTQGYGGTAMSDLAKRLGMRKASLYHHFRTKDTLLYELSAESLRHVMEAATTANELDPLPRLRAIIEGHIKALLTDQSQHATALTELRALSPEQRDHILELRDRYERIIDEAIRSVQAADHLWPDVPPKLLRLAVLGMLNWTVFWHQEGGPETAEGIADVFGSLFVGTLQR